MVVFYLYSVIKTSISHIFGSKTGSQHLCFKILSTTKNLIIHSLFWLQNLFFNISFEGHAFDFSLWTKNQQHYFLPGVIEDNGVEKSLTITHFFTIFFFLFSGMFVSTLIFIGERYSCNQNPNDVRSMSLDSLTYRWNDVTQT